MKEKHPGLPTIRAISVLYMIIRAVGSRFYPFCPVDPCFVLFSGLQRTVAGIDPQSYIWRGSEARGILIPHRESLYLSYDRQFPPQGSEGAL